MIHVNEDYFLSSVCLASYLGLKGVLNQDCALFPLLHMKGAVKCRY